MKKHIVTLTTTTLLTLGGLVPTQALVEDIDIDIDTNVNLSSLSIYTTLDYETEYVFRGQQLADHSFQPSIEATLNGFYAGMWNNLPIVDSDEFSDEIDFYLGCNTPIHDLIYLDLGFTYYWYPDSDNFIDRSREFKVGLSFEVPFNPAFYYYYDVDLQQSTFELSGGKAFDLSQWVDRTSFEVGSYVGIVDASNLDAGQDGYDQTSRFTERGLGQDNAYTYWGATVDLVYNFTETARGKIGVRYAGNNDGESYLDTQTGEREDSVWWGASFSAGF